MKVPRLALFGLKSCFDGVPMMHSRLKDVVVARLAELVEHGDQAQIAKLASVVPSAVSKWLADGSGLTLEYIELICRYKGVSVASLMTMPGEEHEPLTLMEQGLIRIFRDRHPEDQAALIRVLESKGKRGDPRRDYRRVLAYAEATARLTDEAIEVARRYQKAPELTQQQIARSLALGAPGRTGALLGDTPDAPDRGSGSPERSKKLRRR